MGCDGGTIPRRNELVRRKKKREKKDKDAQIIARWKYCAISQEPLKSPIVACELGKLYNKRAVLEHLLYKGNATAEAAGHIKKMYNVVPLNLSEKAGYKDKGSPKGDEYVDIHYSRYVCPVTGLEMNGKQRFYFVWKCGCVLSERAIKEVKSETCHKCGKAFEENDLIILNGTDEEVEVLQKKMVERRRLANLEKKKKKCESFVFPEAKKIKIEPVDFWSNSSSDEHSAFSNGIDQEDRKSNILHDIKIKVEPGLSSASTSGASTIPAKEVNGMKKGKIKSGKCKVSHIYAGLPEKAKETYSIAKDPSASEVYKSLFTSHSTAKKQDKVHWITYNPQYY